MNLDRSAEILFDNQHQDLPQIASLTNRPGVTVVDGALFLRGPMAVVFERIDEEVKLFAHSLGAESAVLPGSISLKNLDRCRYLDRFPQFLNVISVPDEEKPQRACCSAVCLSCYPHFEKQSLHRNTTLTAVGRVFRNEVLDSRKIERLKEFNMREIIFIGTSEFVALSLQQCLDWLKDMALNCRLQGSIESAEDPFFGPESSVLASYQRVARSKFELLLRNPDSNEKIAVASTNDHGSHFSKAYEIKLENNDFATTGCFGVGLERLLLMISYQYGFEPERWPEYLKKRFYEIKRAP